ncbi:glucose dehydrogenase [Trichonephila clavipes]|uniref:Glucose dehydrogenase n=1 Tax=Trichonephila clavipes TaxID=2585209 RepID=A0A8X6SA50_TRICX|nr:glucose dehydrogenase [Trichonephila clavipes]
MRDCTYVEKADMHYMLGHASGNIRAAIIIDNFQAKGVLFDFEGQTREVRARKEVILSAGAINTAQLLMLSGIGSRQELEKHNASSFKFSLYT